MKRVDAAKYVYPRAMSDAKDMQPLAPASPFTRRLGSLRLLAASLLMALVLSCQGRVNTAPSDARKGPVSPETAARTEAARKPAVTRLIDESLALLFPEAASQFSRLPDASGGSGSAPIPLAAMSGTMDKVLGRWESENAAAATSVPATGVPAAAPMPGAVILSPLAAADLLRRPGSGADSPPSLPPLVVPFAAGDFVSDRSGMYSVGYDYDSAYAAMGKKAGAYLNRSVGEKGAKTLCGFVFQENFMRGHGALEAFTAAFRAEVGEGRLLVRELSPDALRTDAVGATQEAVAMILGGEASNGLGAEATEIAVVALAIDNAFIADSAAAGAGKGKRFLVDASAWGAEPPEPRRFSYRIDGDQERLARAALQVARDLAAGRPAAKITKIPLRYGPVFPKIF